MERITVVGIGDSGMVVLHHMMRSGFDGAEFVAVGADDMHLAHFFAEHKISLHNGFPGPMAIPPEKHAEAILSRRDEVVRALGESTVVFLVAGMGGRVGTGVAPAFARIAQEQGLFTVAVVTLPFRLEGTRRVERAEDGIEALRKFSDALYVFDLEILLSGQTELSLRDFQRDDRPPIILPLETEDHMNLIERFAQADEVIFQLVKRLIEGIAPA